MSEVLISKFIDHTLLRVDASQADYERFCHDAMNWAVYGVCVPIFWVPWVRRLLLSHGNSSIKVVTVVGFPLGYDSWEIKKAQVADACRWGVDEIDWVINVSALKSGYHELIRQEIFLARELWPLKTLKIIGETLLLTPEEKQFLVDCCCQAQVDFIKTGTGYSGSPVSVDEVTQLKQMIGSRAVKIKASGGIRTRDLALKLVAAGADRLGTSSTAAILGQGVEDVTGANY